MKVLLVEDEQSMLFTLTNLLRHRGHEVIAAPSAEEGLDELGDNQVDLVISDLRLPGMDGISLIAEVRERCEDVVPIIITGYGTLGNAIDALKLSVCDFLRKPFDLTTFEETISRAEERRTQLLANKKSVCELKTDLMGEELRSSVLSPFLSKNVLDYTLPYGEAQLLSNQAHRVSILFADISDFTGLSERLDQNSLILLVKTFYSALEPIISQYGGIVDKFMGDGIMMVFADSHTGREAASYALGAAVQIQDKMASIRRELSQFELPEISVHIGISTGLAAACSVGTEVHLAHTYIGDAVNLAKRLQDLAGPGEIVLSEATASDLAGYESSIPGLIGLHPLPPLAIKGRQDKIVVYRAEYSTSTIYS